MRPRTKDRHLPPCVYWRHGQYWYVKRKKWHPLGADLGKALSLYASYVAADKNPGGMERLVTEALAEAWPRLSVNTRKNYSSCAKIIQEMFRNVAPEQVTPRVVVDMRRMLADTPAQANMCMVVLRLVFNHALETGVVETNPVIGVKKMAQKPRDRLITSEEYARIYAHASDKLQVIMDLSFLTGQRVNDVLRIRRADLTAEGIAFKQQKTGARLVVAWTPELRAVVDRAIGLHGLVAGLTLLPGHKGKPPDYTGVWKQWQAACKAAGAPPTQLRDLRPMSITAAKQQGLDATAVAGHASPTMTKRYLRGKESPLVQGPKLRSKT